jgi:hypothetical protein
MAKETEVVFEKEIVSVRVRVEREERGENRGVRGEGERGERERHKTNTTCPHAHTHAHRRKCAHTNADTVNSPVTNVVCFHIEEWFHSILQMGFVSLL